MKYNSVFFVVAMVVSIFVVGCSSSTGLPEDGKMALYEKVQEIDSGANYEIASAQKGNPQSSLFGNIPDEVWCITLDRAIVAQDTRQHSHFLVKRKGLLWTVEAADLFMEEEDVFLRRGCSNW